MSGGNIEITNYEFRKRTKAFALVVIDEINIIRNKAGLSLRDSQYWRDAVDTKLAEMEGDIL